MSEMNWTEIMNNEMFDLCADLKACDISDILGGHFECDGELDELQMRKWAFLETLEEKSNTILGYVLLELSEMYERRTGRPVELEEDDDEEEDDEEVSEEEQRFIDAYKNDDFETVKTMFLKKIEDGKVARLTQGKE